ncbi:helix-turn-helix domain-containing protein [Streptomyces sp. RB110-1]|uniref:helix-turn-helix domain-containing protein n=1 Tax=unclassified Streptomyces TaxID=2593676 RepID=UPI0018FFF0CA|nr:MULTISPECIES: helix-turn-helix domain-containing protein [unclassified Streptomyces]MBK0374891.1 helix-turn-helix domain-containing protein [Streptomyces sp. RB110-1]MBK0388739.1 helix-turn-helix domain-containing protein [Streptomyces sp. RB110-2]
MTRSTTDEAAAEPLPSPKERRRLREAKSLSEDQVAAAVGVTRATVRSWETGRTSPRGRKRALYAKVLAAETKPGAEPEASPGAGPGPGVESVTEPTAGPGVESVTEPTATEPAVEPAAVKPAAVKPTTVKPAAVKPAAVVAVATEPVVEPGADSAGARPAAKPAGRAAGKASTKAAVRPAPHPVTRPESVTTGAEPERGLPAPPPPEEPDFSPADAFDELYARTAPGLVRQTYLLTGRRALALESVERAFQLAWHRWPEVAVDRDPAGWVRAAAYEFAMSPWHRMRRTHRHPDAPPTEPGRRALFDALLDLPPAYRRTLLLYDGVGLDLPETAAETEASTPAAAGRLMTARAALAERFPEVAEAASPAAQSALLHERLGGLARAENVPVPRPAEAVRTGGENRARLWTRAAIAGVALLMVVTGLTLHTAPTHYEQPISPAERVGGVPPRGGPQQLTAQDLKLQRSLREQVAHGPERLVPETR